MLLESISAMFNSLPRPRELRVSFWLAFAVITISVVSLLRYSIGATEFPSTSALGLDPSDTIGLAICGMLILSVRQRLLNNTVPTETLTSHRGFCVGTGLAIAAIGLLNGNPVEGSLFALAGLGFATFSLHPKNPLLWQVYPVVGLILSVLIANGFLFNFSMAHLGIGLTSLAFSSNLAFIFIFIDQLFLGGGVGILQPFYSPLIGAKVMRTKGPIAILFFIGLAKLLHIGVREHFYDLHFGLVLFVTLAVAMFFFVFLDLAFKFNQAHNVIQDSGISKEKLLGILETQNAELEQKRQRLERSNKDLEIFAGAAAHDLKSPLQSTISWIAILRDSLAGISVPLAEQAITMIKRNAEKSMALVNDLLQLSRLNGNHGAVVEVDLNVTLEHLKTVLAEEIAKSAATITNMTMPRVRTMPAQIENVLSNLIRNAINYRDVSRPLEINIGFQDCGDNFEFYVADNGIGIPSDKLEKIFVLFERLHSDDDYAGTGMGLAYCQKAIELRGGKIWATSELGRGTQIHFTIPRA
ncbi:MAG: ATP-binding protein [Pseudomonadota bacterium]